MAPLQAQDRTLTHYHFVRTLARTFGRFFDKSSILAGIFLNLARFWLKINH